MQSERREDMHQESTTRRESAAHRAGTVHGDSAGRRESGIALILAILAGGALLLLSYLSVQTTLVESVTRHAQHDVFLANQIANSAASQALAKIKEAGITTPHSGTGAGPEWVGFSEGAYYYYAIHDAALEVSVIRAWGRIASSPTAVVSTEAPDSGSWDGTGWTVQGLEITVKGYKYLPETPMYFGNGGVERPMGGFDWTRSSDPSDPSTWGIVTSPTSYQSSSVPFEISTLDHPVDYLYGGGPPAPATTYPHPYKVWMSQNPFGQKNVEAWFANSAGAGYDPTIGVTPPPTASYYNVADRTSPDYPYPVSPNIPDVQNFAFELWNKYKDDPSATKLRGGAQRGTYGDLANPSITFVTGDMLVNSSSTFKGAGILLIRDDYDPNVDRENMPSRRAHVDINGTFEWTGLVVVAGWAPDVNVAPTADMTIVGALFGEDSVQSGGEISLDSSTIILKVQGPMRVLYSNAIFQEGGLAHEFLPAVVREVVGIRNI